MGLLEKKMKRYKEQNIEKVKEYGKEIAEISKEKDEMGIGRFLYREYG